MVIINDDDFETRFPCGNDKLINKMDEENKDTYLSLYMKYSELFNKYIIDKLDLDEYDKKLENSNLEFTPVTEQNMDIYQYLSHDMLKYLYIRNNYYVERLTKTEKEFLLEKIFNSDEKNDNETRDFIENTYEKVIYEDVSRDNQVFNINFGPESETFLAPNNALVIGIRYDEFNTNGMTDKEWDCNYNKQLEELFGMMNNIELVANSKLNIPVRVIQYNEFSIKKKSVGKNNNDIIKK